MCGNMIYRKNKEIETEIGKLSTVRISLGLFLFLILLGDLSKHLILASVLFACLPA